MCCSRRGNTLPGGRGWGSMLAITSVTRLLLDGTGSCCLENAWPNPEHQRPCRLRSRLMCRRANECIMWGFNDAIVSMSNDYQ